MFGAATSESAWGRGLRAHGRGWRRRKFWRGYLGREGEGAASSGLDISCWSEADVTGEWCGKHGEKQRGTRGGPTDCAGFVREREAESESELVDP